MNEGQSMRMKVVLAVLSVGLLLAGPGWASEWLAASAPTEAEIERLRAEVDRSPAALAPRWRLLESLHFLSEFTDASEERQAAAVEEAVDLAGDSLSNVDALSFEQPDTEVARLYFWSAIAWGARGQRVGLLTIVREGVAKKMYEYAARAAELDPTVERGGAYRLLSRLHAQLPRVPFISGWVDREQVLPMAERAHLIAPNDPGNQLVLALALIERAPERRDEALALLGQAARAEPRPELRAPDLAIRAEASERLEALTAPTE